MSDINVIVNDEIVNIDVIDEPVLVNVVNSPGVPGAPGAPGVGVPVGGTTGQVLKKLSNTNYDTYWAVDAGGISSIGLTMPSAFAVANSPLTANGTLAVTGAGTSAQYIRGDGQLANFPSIGGGGSAYNYYLNGSVNQGTFGADTYYEMSKTPVLGAGTNFTRTNGQGNGYIASFITDAGDPSLLNIPGGNWNLEFYFQSSASGGSPQFYAELYKVSSSNVFTLVASGSTNPEGITNGTTVDQYFTSIPVPQTSLLVTDRLAIRIYVITSGRTITLHTEDGNLCEILTTFSTGLNALNGLTTQVQYFATGTSGTDFAISSATDTHTFNLPTASSINRGALSSADWTTFNGKQNALGYTPANSVTTLTINGVTYDLSANRSWTISAGISGSGASGQVSYWDGTTSQAGSNNLFWDNANGRLGIGTNAPATTLSVTGGGTFESSTTIASITSLKDFGYNVISQIPQRAFIYGRYSGNTSASIGIGGNSRGNTSLQAFNYTNNTATPLSLQYLGGNVIIGSYSADSGERLQVQGTTLLNGNVTFSSATGMFWDATNSRLGIGTNAPSVPLHINSDLSGLSNGLAITKSGVAFADANFQITNLTGTAGLFIPYFVSTSNSNIGASFGIRMPNTSTSDIGLIFEARNKNTNSALSQGYIASFRSFITDYVRIAHNGNLLLQNGGTFTDSGERLQVTGTMKVTGEGSIAGLSIGLGGGSLSGNLRFGTNALSASTTGNNNLAIGSNSLRVLTTSSSNTAVGLNALENCVGFSNNAFGRNALQSLTSGNNNMAIGISALTSNTTGSDNVALGAEAGRYAGSSGTAMTSVNNSIYIGYQSRGLNATGSTNEMVFGYNVVGGGSNTCTLGNTSITKTILRGTINAANLPTSSSGLATGDLWNDAGTIKIV